MAAPTTEECDRLRSYCKTDRHHAILDGIEKKKPYGAIAAELSVDKAAVGAAVQRLRAWEIDARGRGVMPEFGMSREIPEPYFAKGFTFSDRRDPETGEWTESIRHTKLDVDKALRMQGILEAVEKRCEGITPLAPVPAPEFVDADLMNLVTITDYHFGQLSWGPETGADWDLGIARDMFWRAVSGLIADAPKARTGFLNLQGDLFHADGIKPFTPTSGHLLDTDSRWSRVVSVVMEVTESAVHQMLEHHEKVVVLVAEGNHDIEASGVWLRKYLARVFRDNPRVKVINSERPFYCYEFGQVMLFIHHGHLKKKVDLYKVAASMFAEIWGRTTKRYGHTGHYHHKHTLEQLEGDGWTLTQHQTLAAKDAHSARHGYEAERKATNTTYHRRYGEWKTNSITPEMMRAA